MSAFSPLSRRALLTGAAAVTAAPVSAQRAYAPPQIVVRAAPPVPLQPMLVLTGTQGGTFVRLGADLSTIMSDAGLELSAESSRGSFDNVRRLLTQRGVDLAFVAADTLAYARTQAGLPGLNRVQYIARLGTNDFHLVARDPGIRTIRDLAGKRVVMDVMDSGTSVTAPAVFRASDVAVTPVYQTPRRGLEMLKRGEVDAVSYGIGKPGDLFMAQPQGSLHFVAVPITEALAADYLPQAFAATDYPNLIPDGPAIEGVAVGVALACFGWTTASGEIARCRAVEQFVRLFVAGFGELQKPPFHPQWQDVSLAATLPGWTRFASVEPVLRAMQAAGTAAEREAAFGAFLTIIGRADAAGADRERLRAAFNDLRARAR